MPTSSRPAYPRRLAVVAATLLALVLGAAVAVHASTDAAPAAAPDGRTRLMILPYAFDSGGNQVQVDALVQAGPTVWLANNLVLDVGPSVALSVVGDAVWIGQTAGYASCWRFGGWSHQVPGGSLSGESSGRNVSLDGISDVNDSVDHYLWLRYYYYIDYGRTGACYR
jgi:hypothetical protein